MAELPPTKAVMAAPALSPPSETDALAVGLGAMVVGGGAQSGSDTSEPTVPSGPRTPEDENNFGENAMGAMPYQASAETLAIASRIAHRARGYTGHDGFVPRADRVRTGITANNAQGLYPPSALLFIANLSNQRSVEQLEVSCQQVFSSFGPCHVKVRYDRNKHPFAFVQFESDEDASAAVDGSVNLSIDDRRIRVERAKAERAVILSNVNGIQITEDEARFMLERYGPIEIMATTEKMDNPPRNNIKGGMYVKFAFYLDCQDALKAFPHHTSGYILILAPSLEPRVHYNRGTPVVRGFSTPRSAVDQKSIFVGNLPEGTTRSDLHDLFDEFGMIVQVNVIRKVFGDDGVNNFGFVEFSTVQEAEHASHAERTFKNTKLRIEPKEYSVRRNPSHTLSTSYIPPTPAHTFTPRNHFENLNYLNASRLPFAQPVFNHTQANNTAALTHAQASAAMTQAQVQAQAHANATMTGIHTQGFTHLEHQNPLHSYSLYSQGSFTTPPHHSANRIASHGHDVGMFSPTPSHHAHPFNPIVAPQTPQYSGQPFGTTHFMNPIQEAEGEEY
ncbi:hypothetical protein LTR84_005209 [Exophiala bonariae]|uniref:RRM domain-containing protein n=1 Tax=Exophiala bonariae TaxID=1690606 RepID=A0AAV9NQ17_9EURO|nr:hypothetical protein LTR84_005209 [Exophiala bonariae]